MVTINDLPVEILTIIFKHLTPAERCNASVVNKYWYHIWTSTVFDKDRTLKFNNCIIKSGTSPASVFKDTNRRYHNLILENVDLQDTFLEMWSRLGKYVQYLEFDRSFVFNKQKHADFLKQFPNLRTLKINFNYWKDESYGFNVMPSKVEKLILTFGPYHGSVKSFEKILSKIKVLKELELENIELSEEFVTLLPKILKVLRKLSIRVYSDQIKSIRKLHGPLVNHLTLKEYGPEINNILPVVLYGFPKLQHFTLETRDVLPCKNCPKLKCLKVSNLEYVADSMRLISDYLELEVFEVSIWEQSCTDCFFGHKIYNNSSIRTLKILTHKTNVCQKCMETVVRSLPNLKHFEIDLHLQQSHIESIRTELPHLSILKHNDYTGF